MTGKGRRECIPPAYAEWVGRQLLSAIGIAHSTADKGETS